MTINKHEPLAAASCHMVLRRGRDYTPIVPTKRSSNMSRALLPVLASLALVACGNSADSPSSAAAATQGDAQSTNTVAVADSPAEVATSIHRPAETPASPAQAVLASTDADLANGQRQFRRCQSCHTINEGGRNTVGPNLHDVFGRPAASAAGFSYSRALSESGLTWDHDTLDAWIENPHRLVPGTRMSFVGLRDADDRRDVIAYLESMRAGEN